WRSSPCPVPGRWRGVRRRWRRVLLRSRPSPRSGRWSRTQPAPPGGTCRRSLLLVFAAAVATAGASIWAVVQAGTTVEAGQLSALRMATRLGLATIVGGFLVGAARNVWPAVRNAYVFSRGAQAPSGARLWSFISVLADELLPGRVVGRRV